MKRVLQRILFWILNLFSFSRPYFVEFEYADYVINNKSYFLLSWHCEHAYKLVIPKLHYTSFKKHASAYVAVPEAIDTFEIRISNSWHHAEQTIHLKRTEIGGQVDFSVVTNFEQFKKNSSVISLPELNTGKFTIKTLDVRVINLTAPKTQNLNYN